jgi:NADH-ubiquinone oxidoreductase chain 5
MGYFSLKIRLLPVAMITKSAQIPFSAWLPQAIAAPTPVSALVHSSTLVTAGVYLAIRNTIVLPNFLFYLAFATVILAGLRASVENDIKKIIALSTLRQIAFMILLSLKDPLLCFFHLISHAVFKRILFLSAGNFLHACNSIQDIRSVIPLIKPLILRGPITLVGSASLMGMPFLVGFYSKEFLVERLVECLNSNFII